MGKSLNKRVDKYNIWVWVLSISIPVVVAILFLIRIPNVDSLSFLPPIYAAINAATSIILTFAYLAIKRKKTILHERLMKIAIGLSVVFLVMYVAYHMTSDPTPYGRNRYFKVRILLYINISHFVINWDYSTSTFNLC